MSAGRFDREEFLELGEGLVRRRGNPAAERSATSRAYYAAFHRAVSHVSGWGLRLTFTGEDHALVWDRFLSSGSDQELRGIGNSGHWPRRARRRADYDAVSVRNPASDSQSAVRLARRIVAELKRTG